VKGGLPNNRKSFMTLSKRGTKSGRVTRFQIKSLQELHPAPLWENEIEGKIRGGGVCDLPYVEKEMLKTGFRCLVTSGNRGQQWKIGRWGMKPKMVHVS